MSGLFSRTKGRRGEQQLVLYLLNQGFTKAERILRQYQQAGQPDVVGSYKGKEYTFELKTYKDQFKSIYDFYYSVRTNEFPIVGLVVGNPRMCVAISTDFTKLESTNDIIFDYPQEDQKVIVKRLLALNAKRGVADFLVLKDNNKPRLFLRYWV